MRGLRAFSVTADLLCSRAQLERSAVLNCFAKSGCIQVLRLPVTLSWYLQAQLKALSKMCETNRVKLKRVLIWKCNLHTYIRAQNYAVCAIMRREERIRRKIIVNTRFNASQEYHVSVWIKKQKRCRAFDLHSLIKVEHMIFKRFCFFFVLLVFILVKTFVIFGGS